MERLENIIKTMLDKKYLMEKYGVSNIKFYIPHGHYEGVGVIFIAENLTWDIQVFGFSSSITINGHEIAKFAPNNNFTKGSGLNFMEKLIKAEADEADEEDENEKMRLSSQIDPTIRKLLNDFTWEQLVEKFKYYMLFFDESTGMYLIYKNAKEEAMTLAKIVKENDKILKKPKPQDWFENTQKMYNITNMNYNFDYKINDFVTEFTISYNRITLTWIFRKKQHERMVFIQPEDTDPIKIYYDSKKFFEIERFRERIPLSVLTKISLKELILEYNKLYKFFEQMILKFEFQNPLI